MKYAVLLLGTNTIALMSGSECYDSMKINFKDCWEEINQIVADGGVEINPGRTVPVEILLSGDYKVKLSECKHVCYHFFGDQLYVLPSSGN